MTQKPVNFISVIALILLSVIPTASATFRITGDPGTGNDILWVVLTIGLTLLFLMKPVVSMLVRNPILAIPLIIGLIAVYIIIKAIIIVYDIGSGIDQAVIETAETLSTFGGK